MNKGLKRYCNYYTHDIENIAKMFINLNGAYKNMHIVYPLFKTKGTNPIELSLIYHHESTESTLQFGKGMRLNYFHHYLYNPVANIMQVTNNDGSVDTESDLNSSYYDYVQEPYYLDDYTFTSFKDKNGNNMIHSVNGEIYPVSIEKNNGQFLTFTQNGNNIQSITNGYGDEVTFTQQTIEGYVCQVIKYLVDSVVYRKVIIFLSASNEAFKIRYYEGESLIVNEVLITYESSSITVMDNILLRGTRCTTLSSQYQVEDIYKDDSGTTKQFAKEIIINYLSLNSTGYNNTEVLYDFGYEEKYQFNEHGLLETYTGVDGNSYYYLYDLSTKMVKSSNFLGLNDDIDFAKDQFDFDIIQSDDVQYETLYDKLAYIVGYKTYTYSINKSGNALDRLHITFLMSSISQSGSGAIEIEVKTGSSSKTNVFTNTELNKLEMLNMQYNALSNYNNIIVTIRVYNGSKVRIGGFHIVKKAFNGDVEYTQNKKISSLNNGNDVISYDYNDQDKLSAISKNNEMQASIVHRPDSKYTKITDKNGVTTELIYKDTHAELLEKQTTYSYGMNRGIANKYIVYSSDNRKVEEEFDERNLRNSYDYDDLERITNINNDYEALEFAYDINNGLLKSVTKNKNTSNMSNTYTYDEKKRLSSVTTATETKYTFEYNEKNLLYKVSQNSNTLITYIYNDKNQIKYLCYGSVIFLNGNAWVNYDDVEFKEYNSMISVSGAPYYSFVYDSKGRLSKTLFNGVEKFRYTYNTKEELVSVLDVIKNTTKTYTYNEFSFPLKEEGMNEGTPYLLERKVDHKDNIYQMRRKINNKTILEEFDSVERCENVGINSLNNDVRDIAFSKSYIISVNQNGLESYKVFPLHNSTDSCNNDKALAFNVKSLNNNPFVYNSKNERYCYKPSSASLSYSLGNSTSGTVFMKVFNSFYGAEHTILEMYDGADKRISLVINSNLKFALKFNNVEILTGPAFTNSKWHTVGFSYNQTFAGYYSTTFKLIVDGVAYTTSKQHSGSLGTFTTYIGNNSTQTSEFKGQIEMLAFKNSYVTDSEVAKSLTALDIISSKFVQDEFGRPSFKELKEEDRSLLKSVYTYKLKEASLVATDYDIKEENIYANNTLLVKKEYQYDSLGRITKIIDPEFGNYEYVYSTRGFLAQEKKLDNNGNLASTISYIYDSNGNITNNNGVTYTYDTYIKDRLKSVGSTTLTYGNTNVGAPLTIGNKTLTWEGRRLTKIADSSGYHEFHYDESGNRTSKENHQGITTKYFYEGNKLLTEIKGTTTIDYLYDVTNSLIGFIYNGVKYYYVRDILQNINGIIDGSGNLVVKYSYTAYGKVTVVSDTSGVGIGSINPFRYKGYYYDVETQLYWVSSRYYSPELCRWISPDSIEYLDPESINGLNLYCYCMNNPIMYADPSGCFPVLACILGLTALVGMGLTIGGVASDNNLMTAIGLTMVAIPALISGGMALYCAGAVGTMAIGGITAVAGLGTGLFASAEYQETFTGNNWMLDAGMSEEWYNGLMLATAAIATAGTVASMAGVTRYQKFGNSNWHGGWRKMRSHFIDHGKPQMGYTNVFDYTNGAKAIINNGGVYASKVNAYAQWISGNKYFFVGVGQNSNLITTYFIRTIKYAKYLSML